MDKINLMRTFFLISAILNLITAIVWFLYTILGGLVSCGIGCIMGFLPAISIIATVMDFIAYNKLNVQNKTGTYSSVQFAAIFDIISILTGNIVSMVFGILNLMFLNEEETRNYLIQRGIY
jgi:polyferredoxin